MTELDDPKHRPEPPPPPQAQPVPGFSDKMDPKPDYGEDSYRGSRRLQDRIAVVTGGDSGIGRAVCLAFARGGADVVVSYLSEDEDAKETHRLVESAGRKALLIRGDITEEGHCLGIVDEAVKTFGRVDILVNNAAYQMTRTSLDEITTEEWDRTFKTNVRQLLADQGGAAAYEAGRLYHQHRVGKLRHATADARSLRGDEGGHREFQRRVGAASRRQRDSREFRRAGADLDAPNPVHHAGRAGKVLWPANAVRASRPASRTRARLCSSGLA
jgi:NAD(P)-dependent dehydrogenase (short-subunit alcohol dehydrogenase family)